jgi:hypothetical protein
MLQFECFCSQLTFIREDRESAVFNPLGRAATKKKYQNFLASLVAYVVNNRADQTLIPASIAENAEIYAVNAFLPIREIEECLPLLHILLYSIIDTFPETNDLALFHVFPVYQFLIFSCVEADKAIAMKGKISPKISGLQYAIRLILGYELKINGYDNAELKDQLLLIERNRHTPMAALFWAKTILHEKLPEKVVPIISWKRNGFIGTSDTELIIRDKEVSIAGLRSAVQRAISEAEILLSKTILRGFNATKYIPTRIEDVPNNLNSGFSFLKISGESAWSIKGSSLLYQHLSDHLGLSLSRNTVHRSSAGKWLRSIRKLTEIVLFLIHVTSGQPARATELVTLQYSNTAFCRRHLFFLNGQLLINPVYNKTNSMLQFEKSIFRCIPEVVARLLTPLLAFVRPIQMYILLFLF